MTGIEQLRKLGADAVRGGEVGRAICDIADQIERERECERDTIENLRLELGEARDDSAWVREHGGLERIKNLLNWVLGHCSTKEQLDFDFWLSGRVMHELGFDEDMADRDEVERRLLARLMPEVMEWLVEAWPRFEDDAPVRLLDDFERYGEESVVSSVTMCKDGSFALNCCAYSKGERVNRPTPKALDADGVEIRVGDTVYLLHGDWCDEFPCLGYHGGEKLEVFALHADHVEGGIGCRDVRRPRGTCYPQPSQLTHRAPVLAADGKLLREGETVWDVDGCGPLAVWSLPEKSDMHVSLKKDGTFYYRHPEKLTHERPESWKRLEEDANDLIYDIGFHLGDYSPSDFNETGDSVQDRVRDLVRRAKALAERDR